MSEQDELDFYDLKSAAQFALANLKMNCDKTGRDWKNELADVIYDAEK